MYRLQLFVVYLIVNSKVNWLLVYIKKLQTHLNVYTSTGIDSIFGI